jgi:hypothetical protein
MSPVTNVIVKTNDRKQFLEVWNYGASIYPQMPSRELTACPDYRSYIALGTIRDTEPVQWCGSLWHEWNKYDFPLITYDDFIERLTRPEIEPGYLFPEEVRGGLKCI